MFVRNTILILTASTATGAAADAAPSKLCINVVSADATSPANARSDHFLLTDSLGKEVRVTTSDVPHALHPPAAIGGERQIPSPVKGTSQSEPVRQRIADSKSGQETLQWFPATPPVLAPYLGGLDEFGDTAIQPRGLFATDPLRKAAQAGKFWLSGLGLRENFSRSVTAIGMSDMNSGSSTLQYCAADFLAKWAVFESPGGGPAGWLSLQVNAQLGLSSASRAQSPQKNLATIVYPQANVDGPNGIRISRLTWQQSFREGSFVLLAGSVDQGNHLEAKSYANNAQGQFLNRAFVNNSVLPLPSNNLGVSVQWQPDRSWYVLFVTVANNQSPGQAPLSNLSLACWSYVLELGLTPEDVVGPGPRIYRIQPFLAIVDGETQVGIGLNVPQQLGENSPFAGFGRFGVGGSQVTLAGARAQASIGVTISAPLKYAGLVARLSNDVLGLGFVWSQPPTTTHTGYNENEFALETCYTLQVTSTVRLQPDPQVVWNSAFNSDPGPAFVWQIQLNIVW